MAAVQSCLGFLPEDYGKRFLDIDVEDSPRPFRRRVILIGSSEKISMVRDVIASQQGDVELIEPMKSKSRQGNSISCLGLSEERVLELFNILVEEYGLILKSEILLDEIEKDIPKILKEVDPDPDEFRFSKPVKRKIGRVNTTPFISQKRIRRKH